MKESFSKKPTLPNIPQMEGVDHNIIISCKPLHHHQQVMSNHSKQQCQTDLMRAISDCTHLMIVTNCPMGKINLCVCVHTYLSTMHEVRISW